MKHTSEPWEIIKRAGHPLKIGINNREIIATVFSTEMQGSKANQQANAERIVDCVNGCKGINPEAVPELLAALEAIRNDSDAWLEGEMDSLSQNELMMAFISTANAAIAEAKRIKEG